jgi:hypothetical protein
MSGLDSSQDETVTESLVEGGELPEDTPAKQPLASPAPVADSPQGPAQPVQ